MSVWVISDLHLGSPHCRGEALHSLLDGLGAGETLVLNGDVVDFWTIRMPPRHAEFLARLAERSRAQRVVWVRGNHDPDYMPADPGAIEFAPHFSLPGRVFVAHGHQFDTLRPYNRWFIILFKHFHRLRVTLGAPAVHVAYYAKKFRLLYGVLRRTVAVHAAASGRDNGFPVVVCGHTHYREEREIDGIRVLNTGAWTEPPMMAVRVEAGAVSLIEIPEAAP
jgi:UDP-2,3-diacylglucosamine pyrophosphatase LpxH